MNEVLEFESTNKLDFECAPCAYDKEWTLFRVGTCEGMWRATENSYDILAITNNVKGNGHFNDVLEWFENSCKRDCKSLRVLEIWNKSLYSHLTREKGFKYIDHENVEKTFNN